MMSEVNCSNQHPNDPGARFCVACGEPLLVPDVPATTAQANSRRGQSSQRFLLISVVGVVVLGVVIAVALTVFGHDSGSSRSSSSSTTSKSSAVGGAVRVVTCPASWPNGPTDPPQTFAQPQAPKGVDFSLYWTQHRAQSYLLAGPSNWECHPDLAEDGWSVTIVPKGKAGSSSNLRAGNFITSSSLGNATQVLLQACGVFDNAKSLHDSDSWYRTMKCAEIPSGATVKMVSSAVAEVYSPPAVGPVSSLAASKQNPTLSVIVFDRDVSSTTFVPAQGQTFFSCSMPKVQMDVCRSSASYFEYQGSPPPSSGLPASLDDALQKTLGAGYMASFVPTVMGRSGDWMSIRIIGTPGHEIQTGYMVAHHVNGAWKIVWGPDAVFCNKNGIVPANVVPTLGLGAGTSCY